MIKGRITHAPTTFRNATIRTPSGIFGKQYRIELAKLTERNRPQFSKLSLHRRLAHFIVQILDERPPTQELRHPLSATNATSIKTISLRHTIGTFDRSMNALSDANPASNSISTRSTGRPIISSNFSLKPKY